MTKFENPIPLEFTSPLDDKIRIKATGAGWDPLEPIVDIKGKPIACNECNDYLVLSYWDDEFAEVACSCNTILATMG